MWTYNNVKEIANELNAKIVGSVRTKGRSDHDLDLLVKKYDDSIGTKLESMGYVYLGSQVVSPEEIRKSRKFGRDDRYWLRNRRFENRNLKTVIEVWNIEDV